MSLTLWMLIQTIGTMLSALLHWPCCHDLEDVRLYLDWNSNWDMPTHSEDAASDATTCSLSWSVLERYILQYSRSKAPHAVPEQAAKPVSQTTNHQESNTASFFALRQRKFDKRFAELWLSRSKPEGGHPRNAPPNRQMRNQTNPWEFLRQNVGDERPWSNYHLVLGRHETKGAIKPFAFSMSRWYRYLYRASIWGCLQLLF